MSVSLCMIVKDEENNLPRCLESVKDVVDEMIIVDTGSKDSTVEIANSYGAKVFHFPWNNSFSEARNESLKHATSDWILILDGDDELASSDKLKLLELIKTGDADAYFFETVNYLGDSPGNDTMMNLNLRLFRNRKGYFYSNSVHEQLQSNILAVNPSAKILNESIKIYHYGYLNKNIIEHDKRTRNISLLEKELEKQPGYPFTLFNLASEYFAMNENAKALELFERAYTNFNPAEGFSSKLVLKMASCYINLGKYDNAIKYIDENLKYYPDFTDLLYLKGLSYKWQGKFIQAIKQFNMCIDMGEAPVLHKVIIGAGNFKTYFELGEIYFEFEDYETASDYFNKAIQHNPSFSRVSNKLIKSYCRQKPGYKTLETEIQQLETLHENNFYLYAAELLIEEKYYNLALKFINKHEKGSGSSSASLYSKGLCNLFLKKYSSAFSIMERLKKDPEFAPRVVCCQALCKLIMKENSKAKKILASGIVDQNSVLIKVYKAFYELMEGRDPQDLCEDETESPVYTDCIFDILKILINVFEFEMFEKALALLNTVTDKTVLLRLAKLYYHSGSLGLANQELIRSIKEFGLIDLEGSNMLYKLKYKGL